MALLLITTHTQSVTIVLSLLFIPKEPEFSFNKTHLNPMKAEIYFQTVNWGAWSSNPIFFYILESPFCPFESPLNISIKKENINLHIQDLHLKSSLVLVHWNILPSWRKSSWMISPVKPTPQCLSIIYHLCGVSGETHAAFFCILFLAWCLVLDSCIFNERKDLPGVYQVYIKWLNR